MARETREVWARRVRRWKKSGLTAKDFAAREGVNAKTLSYWRWKLGARPPVESRRSQNPKTTRASFVEVVPEVAAKPVLAASEVVVERERIRVVCDSATARDLLVALGARR
jgi:hypothetical protein